MTRSSVPAPLGIDLLVLLAFLPVAAVAGGDKVGPETCKACHPAAYETWRAGPHARTLEGLPVQSRKDPRCLGCHAPDAEDGLVGVSCEACHGPGRVYAAPYVMRDAELARVVGLTDPGEKSCMVCHGESAPSLVRFDYVKKLPLVDHWTRERQAALRQAQGDRPPNTSTPPAAKGK